MSTSADFFEYRYLTVVKVVDGDTVDVTLDMGYRIYHTVRVRLYGIACDELREAGGKAARDYLKGLIAAEPRLTMRTFKDRTDKYGRFLGDLRGAHGSLNRQMIEGGHARPYMLNPAYDWTR